MTSTNTLAALKRSLAEQPDDRISMTKLGFELVSTNPDEACRHLARVVALSSMNLPAARINLGIAAESSGRRDDAERNYRLALEASPKNEKALRRLVRVLAASKNATAIANLLEDRTRLDLLNDDTRILAALTLGPIKAHQAICCDVLRPLVETPNKYFPAAARIVVNNHLHIADGETQRFWIARCNQLLDPSSGEGAVTIARLLHRRNSHVRAAGWMCQASVLLPHREDVLTTAAEESFKVLWPAHGIATNLRLIERVPGAIPPLERLRPLFKALNDPQAARRTAHALFEAHLDKPTVLDEAIKLLNEFDLNEEADGLWERVIPMFPDIPIFHYNRGISYSGQGRSEEAITNIRRALCLKPDYAKGWNGLSLAYISREDVDDAIFYAERGLHIGLSQDVMYLNLGVYYRAKRRYADSIRASRLAIELTKDPAEQAAAHFNMGMIYFCCGELDAGFRGYMHRWATKNFPSPKRTFRQRIWEGPVSHKNANLLTYMEQGLGDEVMFSWYLPMLRRDVAALTVDCDKRLIPIFERSFPDTTFVPRSNRGHPATRHKSITHKAPIGHVPMHYSVEMKEYIARVPQEIRGRLPVRIDGYLVPAAELTAKWQTFFEEFYPGRKRIGVSWRSKIRNRARNLQYLEIEELATSIPAGTVVVNLQYGTTDEEVERWHAAAEQHGFVFDALDGVDLTNDLDEIFAILKVIDYAVTPLLSIAWMSAAVGCPTLVNRTAWDKTIWQSFGTDFVPWQPSIRLYFRTPKESWAGPLENITQTLMELVARDS